MRSRSFFIRFFFFSSRRRHTRLQGDWSSDVCSSDLHRQAHQRQGSRAKPYTACLLLTLFLVSAAFIIGCGGGGEAPSGAPPRSFTITVTAASGSGSRAGHVKHTVECSKDPKGTQTTTQQIGMKRP